MDLKHCPFCESTNMELKVKDGCHYVFCLACACEGPWMKSATSAATAWNRRFPLKGKE